MDLKNHERIKHIKSLLNSKNSDRIKKVSCGTTGEICASHDELQNDVLKKLPYLRSSKKGINENGRSQRSVFGEILQEICKLPNCEKKSIHVKNTRKLQNILLNNKHKKSAVDFIGGVESHEKPLPPLEDTSSQPFWLPVLGSNNTVNQEPTNNTLAIEIKTIQRLLAQSKNIPDKQSKRKPKTDDKQMYPHALPGHKTLTQKQFAKELSARLNKLALERQEADQFRSETDSKHAMNSSRTKFTKSDTYHVRRNASFAGKQPTKTEDLAVDQILFAERTSALVSTHQKQDKTEQELLEANEEDVKPGESARNTCMGSKEDKHSNVNSGENIQHIPAPSESSSNKQNSGNLSNNQKKEMTGCTEVEELDEPPGAGDTMQTVDPDELDCLDDDKPLMEDIESALDASDSEMSFGEPQSEVANALHPVIASLFPNTPSVIRFVGENQCVSRLPKSFRGRLRWRPSAITPNVVKRLLRRSHFRMTLKSPDWLGYYGNHLKPTAFRPIKEFQKVNHFPGSFQLGRKDKLWSNLSQLRSQFGRKMVDFVPRTFCLPSDARLLKEVWARNGTPTCDCSNNMLVSSARPRWIMKPPASARGIGIKVLRQWSDVPKQRSVLIQSYISRPYLINETKFDLRLYVYVTGFNPFRAYLHREGLVRFASQKYSTAMSDTGNRFIHLTNYSVNKHNTEEQTGVENHKWKLETLWAYLRDRCINVDGLWAQMKDIIFKTLASVTNHISLMVDQNCRRRTCVHELFGFDILLDADLKPWLLEVNVSPSLHTNTTLDNEVKTTLVTDMFNVAGFRLPPEYRSSNQSRTSHEENSISSTNTNDMIGDTSGANKDTTFGDRTAAPSTAESRRRTPVSSHCAKTLPDERNRAIQTMYNSDSIAKHMSTKSGSLGTASHQVVGRSNGSTAQSTTNINHLIPLSDPRLWDLQLTWDERQKHMYHSRLLCKEESALRAGMSSLKLTSGNTRTGRVARHLQPNLFARRSSAQPSGKHPEVTVFDELRGVVSHLTPDDVRTLIDFVDERYRASMGNFECIFPVSGDRGLQLLLILEACATGTNSGNLGLRSPAFRYYDLVQYAFLTVYHRKELNQKSVLKKTQLDSVAICQLPDYHILQHGELSPEALNTASKMTEISREGLIRLIELCKRGYHLSGTEASNQRIRWNQSNTGFPENDRKLFSKPDAPIELGTGRVKSNKQGAKGDGHLDDSGDTVDCILGGAVSFRAQSSFSHPQDFINRCYVNSLQRDSGVGGSIVSSTSVTPGRKPLKVALKPQPITVHHTFVCPHPTKNSESSTPTGRIRPRSVVHSRSSTYPGQAIGETMGWWNRCRSATSTNHFAGPPPHITIPRCVTTPTPEELSAARAAIFEGTYLTRSNEHVDLSNMLNSQSIRELTRSVRQKRKSLEQTRTAHGKFQLAIPPSSTAPRNRNRSTSRPFSHLTSLDPSRRVEQYLNAQWVQQSDMRLWNFSNRERCATPGSMQFKAPSTDSQLRRSNSKIQTPTLHKSLVRAESFNSNWNKNLEFPIRHSTDRKHGKSVEHISSPKRVSAWM